MRQLVDQVQLRLEQQPRNGKRVLVTCGPEDSEELAAQITADLLEADGYEIYYAGGGIANDEIVNQLGDLGCDLLVVFGAVPATVPATRLLIDRLHAIGSCPKLQIVVGGGVFNRAEGLAEEIGADLWATSPADIVAVVRDNPDRRMTPRPTNRRPKTPNQTKRRRRLTPPPKNHTPPNPAPPGGVFFTPSPPTTTRPPKPDKEGGNPPPRHKRVPLTSPLVSVPYHNVRLCQENIGAAHPPTATTPHNRDPKPPTPHDTCTPPPSPRSSPQAPTTANEPSIDTATPNCAPPEASRRRHLCKVPRPSARQTGTPHPCRPPPRPPCAPPPTAVPPLTDTDTPKKSNASPSDAPSLNSSSPVATSNTYAAPDESTTPVREPRPQPPPHRR